MLEFEALGDRNNFIDLQRTRLEIVLRVIKNNGNVLRTHATDAGLRDTPYLVNNLLSSLFSECTLSLNGEKISTTNANFAHKSFIETEFSHSIDAKKPGLLAKAITMRIIQQIRMVRLGELLMLQNVNVLYQLRPS